MGYIVIDGATVTVLPSTARPMAVHDVDECAGRTCVIHSPTDHPMRSFPLHWRGDRGIFERICPHGVGHPDIDQRAYWRSCAEADLTASGEPFDGDDVETMAAGQMVHGCCGRGCCG